MRSQLSFGVRPQRTPHPVESRVPRPSVLTPLQRLILVPLIAGVPAAVAHARWGLRGAFAAALPGAVRYGYGLAREGGVGGRAAWAFGGLAALLLAGFGLLAWVV